MNSAEDKAVGRLARRLRELREHEWPEATLTQVDLARAMSVESRVAPATLSSWESLTNPKTPAAGRLTTYAQFFATKRSLHGEDSKPYLLTLDDLDGEERKRFEQLEEELLDLHAAISQAPPSSEIRRRILLSFDDHEPIVIICPEVPEDKRGPLADENDINYTRMHKVADSDALLEIHGHIRALNPEIKVIPRLPSDVQQTEMQHHVVLIGGIGWNRTTHHFLSNLKKLPISQVRDPRVPDGEVFQVAGDSSPKIHLPVTEKIAGSEPELIGDVGLLAQLPNPFNSSRKMTICNGIHSKGVLGAVLAITDETVRQENERYLARRFQNSDFAMLLRVPVVDRRALAPDLQDPEKILFEWSSES